MTTLPSPDRSLSSSATAPADTVVEFLRALAAYDLDAALDLVTDDLVYTNVSLPTLYGRERFERSGVYYAATAREAQLCRGSTVIVAGGGNSAGQAAMFLSEGTEKVLLLIRGADLAKSMSSYL